MLHNKSIFYEHGENAFTIKDVITQDIASNYNKTNISVQDGIIKKIEYIPLDLQQITEDYYYVTCGFVNSHLHPNQLFDRGMLDNLSITSLINKMHAVSQKTFEDRYIQSLFILMDAIKSGATSVYAVANKPEPVIKAFDYLKLSGAVTCFINDKWEGEGNTPKLTNINKAKEDFFELYKYNTLNLQIHIGTSSISSASNDLLILLDQIAKDCNTKVNIHISEGKEAVASCIKYRGTTPIRLLQKLKVLNQRWNLIHATTIDLEETKIIADSGASVIHCPVSNAKTGVGIAPILELIKHNVIIGLGTDACSNNNTNNILNEAYFAKLLHGSLDKNSAIISDHVLYKWLTTNGYKILGLPQQGKLEVGEPANLLFWSLREPSFVPLISGNLNSAIINNAPDLKPQKVIINGTVVIDNYKFVSLSEEEIIEEANDRAKKILYPLDKMEAI